jgi:molecular chaperone DnaJ
VATKRDYYEVLGVAKDASAADIKKSFRDAAKKWHPDRNPDNKAEAESKFKEIAEAYAVLSDDQKRKQYDQFGHAGMGGAAADFSGVSVEDIFSSFFGGGRGGGGGGSIFEDLFGGGRGQASNQGASLRFELEITLEDAAKGITKNIEIAREELCETCSGSGAKPGTGKTTCSYCQGSGYVARSQGFFTMRTTCPRCSGKGQTVSTPCTECRGSGRKRKKIRLEVPIPAGIEDGTRIRLSGEGEPSESGGPRGDLYVVVHVKEHDYFVRRGNDLLIEMPIPYTMAALGGEIEVPTLEGRVRLPIPKGTQSGQLLRLRSMGVKDVHGYGKGDQFVRVVIETPKKLSTEQEELLRKLAKLDKVQVSPHERGFFDKVKDFFSEGDE